MTDYTPSFEVSESGAVVDRLGRLLCLGCWGGRLLRTHGATWHRLASLADEIGSETCDACKRPIAGCAQLTAKEFNKLFGALPDALDSVDEVIADYKRACADLAALGSFAPTRADDTWWKPQRSDAEDRKDRAQRILACLTPDLATADELERAIAAIGDDAPADLHYTLLCARRLERLGLRLREVEVTAPHRMSDYADPLLPQVSYPDGVTGLRGIVVNASADGTDVAVRTAGGFVEWVSVTRVEVLS